MTIRIWRAIHDSIAGVRAFVFGLLALVTMPLWAPALVVWLAGDTWRDYRGEWWPYGKRPCWRKFWQSVKGSRELW